MEPEKTQSTDTPVKKAQQKQKIAKQGRQKAVSLLVK